MKGSELYEQVKNDLDDRAPNSRKLRNLNKHRLGKRKRNTMYPGAPNFLDPIIDDNVRTGAAQELSVLFANRNIATFVPLDMESAQNKRQAEMAFDTVIRLMNRSRAKAETILDTKRECGWSVAKQTENADTYGRYMGTDAVIPDFEYVANEDIVVPTGTRYLQDAERICQIHTYTVREFKKLAKDFGWQDWQEVLQVAERKAAEEDAGYSDEDGHGKQPHFGLEMAESQLRALTVWEIYHYNEDGEKKRTMLAPAVPDKILSSIPWRWKGETQMVEQVDPITGLVSIVGNYVEGRERRWPFVQFRYENRAEFFYDSRGDGELLIDNQKASTQHLNAKGVQMDFYSKPIVSGARSKANPKIKPGAYWTDDMKFVDMPRVDQIFDYSSDMERAKAARRSGASSGSFADQRFGGGRKTATQVNQEGLNNNRLTNQSVLRDGEPFSELFSLMWEFLQNNPVELPIISESKELLGVATQEILSGRYLILSTANAQQHNPDFVLQQLMQMAPLLQANPFVRQEKMAKYIVDQINPQVTNEIVADPEEGGEQGQLPIATQVQQNAQGIQQLMQQSQQMMQYLQQLAQMDAAEDTEGAA